MIFVSAQFDASAQIFFRAWWWTSQGFDWVSCLPVSRDGCASFLFIFKRLPKQDFARQDIWSSFLNLHLEKETICFLNLHLEKETTCFLNLHLENRTICEKNFNIMSYRPARNHSERGQCFVKADMLGNISRAQKGSYLEEEKAWSTNQRWRS